MAKKKNNHIIVAWAENKPGVLNRLFSLFRRRRFNVESITAGHTETKNISRMTFVVQGSEEVVEQVIKQMYKVVEVTKVRRIKREDAVERELILVKVATNSKTRAEIMQMVNIYRAKIVDVAHTSITIELTGANDKIHSFIDLMKRYGIQELVRTGVTVMKRERA